MTKKIADNFIKEVKLPKKDWKIIIGNPIFPYSKKDLKDANAITDVINNIIFINPDIIKYVNDENLLTIIRHEFGHIFQKDKILRYNCKHHSREWYRKATSYGYSLEDEYKVNMYIFKKKYHEKIIPFRIFLKFLKIKLDFYIPKNYDKKQS